MGARNTLQPPPHPTDPKLFEALVVEWWPYCERWADRQHRARPDVDFGSAANLVLWKAAATFDPGLGHSFLAYLHSGLLRHGWSAATKTASRRAKVMGVSEVDPATLPSPRDEGASADARIDAEPFLKRLASLPDDRRVAAFRGHLLEGRSSRDMAAELGCSYQQVINMARGVALLLAGQADAA